MKQKFSKQWSSSVQVRKQHKYRYNAPLHIKHRFLSAHLSAELRKKYGKRSIPLKKGDEVLIMRGSFKNKKGKVLEVDLKKSRIVVEGVNRQKGDGTKVNIYFHPSNLQIFSLNLDDIKRLKSGAGDKEKKVEEKPTEKPKAEKKTENASDKNENK